MLDLFEEGREVVVCECPVEQEGVWFGSYFYTFFLVWYKQCKVVVSEDFSLVHCDSEELWLEQMLASHQCLVKNKKTGKGPLSPFST